MKDYPDDGEAQIAQTIVGSRRLVVRRTRLIGPQAELVARLAQRRVFDQPHRVA